MVNSYVLVNPHIEGSLKKEIKAKNSLEAAKNLYKNLSEHFNNSVPKFYFTIQKGGSGGGKFYSFKVKETRNDNTVDFSLEPIVIQNESQSYQKFRKNLQKFKKELDMKGGQMEGGAKKSKSKPKKKGSKKKDPYEDDDFMDTKDFYDDDEFDLDKPKSTYNYYSRNSFVTIYHYYYDPYLYNMNAFHVPTFYSYINPFIRINFFPA